MVWQLKINKRECFILFKIKLLHVVTIVYCILSKHGCIKEGVKWRAEMRSIKDF